MIKLSNIRVQGFRLLEDAEIAVESGSTVIVGRNNSGKTSLTEIFEKFLGESAGQFRLEDFSGALRTKFTEAKHLYDEGRSQPVDILKALPSITLELVFNYADHVGDLGPLSPFIIDLDPACTTSIVRIVYSASLATFENLLDIPTPLVEQSRAEEKSESVALFRHLRDAIANAYSIQVFAVDPTDGDNVRKFDNTSALAQLIQTGFVKAQRTLDVTTRRDPDVIGKLLSQLFKTASHLEASQEDKDIVAQLKTSVSKLEGAVQGGFDTQLKGLLPALNIFGFPSLNDTDLMPHTSIDAEDLLTGNTKILYTGADGVHLPEGYNGLGTRNLIYILLQLETLHKSYRATPTRPISHIVFIEEPEAHLHPQMQEVFIAKLNEAVSELSKKFPGEPAWQVQFIVSTHSSHLANAAQFDAIRYFLSVPSDTAGFRRTKVKDFRKGADTITKEDRKFLQQYMTLTKCDLYFADKAILVEGATERILMPRIIEMIDKGAEESAKLGSQYITTMEIGGAYAQKFFPLIEYLELKSLIITDIDAVYLKEKRYQKCLCAKGERTSNSALKSWFNDKEISIAQLLAKTPDEKTRAFYRIAYQTPEDGSLHCARSYEDALILANLDHFEIDDDADAAANAWDKAEGFGKSEEAIRFALMEEEWAIPKYISDGLAWLALPPPPAAAPQEVPQAEKEVA
ncbi:ATP-dependent nuclease [Phaeobacter italicus]|uniref:ATP-dependent nuclease n=1 Tax=Phaeobacter italicus TaxID=481446 RepID=UPI00232BAEE6|nr:ATP-dependent endonuclease [Phaeobacter italicus]